MRPATLSPDTAAESPSYAQPEGPLPGPHSPEPKAMSDPNPSPSPPPALVPEQLPLAESFSLCFNWERLQPLKINIHQDWMAAGHDRIAVKRALGRYGKADRYWKTLQTGASRIDWQGQPAGAVTEREAAYIPGAWSNRRALPPAPPCRPTPSLCRRRASCPVVSNSR